MRASSMARAAIVATGAGLMACAGSSITKAAMPTTAPFAWASLPDLPDAHGFAGAYTGVSNGALIVAGGANFPDAPPWKGGTKTWYDVGFVLPDRNGAWQRIDAALPSARGYGASITTPKGIVCIGGSNAAQHFVDVFTLSWDGKRIHRQELPPLPVPMANFSAAAIDSTIYIAGGIESPTATVALGKFLALDLAQPNPAWRELDTWPGAPRMLAATTAAGGSFYLCSGVSVHADAAGKPARTYLTDAFRYTPGKGWSKIADVPHPTCAAPSPGVPIDGERCTILGGDDGVNVNFEPKEQHPGFNKDVLAYDPATNAWSVVGQLELGQVTTGTTMFNGELVIPSGEVRPGVRTPHVSIAKVSVAPESAR